MICQRCGERDATVHLVKLVDGRRRSQWLCAVCAGNPAADDGEPAEFDFGQGPDEGPGPDDDDSLARFLGQVFERREQDDPPDPPVCPRCGYTLDEFRKTNLLGCPGCYEAFHGPLLAILSHLHRHVSHLGKSPLRRPGAGDRAGALSRARVALEKAIAAEDFEKAALLRDEIQRLEPNQPPGEGAK